MKVIHPEFTARQCTECGEWIRCVSPKGRETQADWRHFSTVHADKLEAMGPNAIGFPYFPWNEFDVEDDPDCANCGWGEIGCAEEATGCRNFMAA